MTRAPDRSPRPPLGLVAAAVLLALTSAAGAPASGPPRFEFTRMLANWGECSDPNYLPFIAEAQPEVAQVGFYGAHFWSLGHTAQYNGYPAGFAVRGLNELGDWFEALNGKLHAQGVKVVGHFNVEFLVGDPDGPDGPTGFFKFYRDLWDEKKLGPKPVADPLDLLEKNADGTPIRHSTYKIGGMNEHWACLRNPAWQAVLKAWIKEGVRRGADGFIANYFYRHNCLCKYCQDGFRSYLKARFRPDELRAKFAIDDLDRHKFTEIVSWHAASETTPLRLEMLRYSQVSNKEVFDEVFNRYGRTVKPDLITAQWNHLGDFAQVDGDERCLLPADLWGQGETYLWYSTGSHAFYTDLKKRFLGEGTLQARYIRGTFDDKPFTLGKYESTRTRVTISEMAANGGAAMGFYAGFTNPLARAEIARYFQFLKRNDPVYQGNRPHAEVALVFPRRDVHRGKVEPVEAFRKLGRALLDAHVLFDVWPDDLFTPGRAANYAKVVTAGSSPEEALAALPERRSVFDAPYTVRVSASRPAGNESEIDLHFVNYNRTEPPALPDNAPNGGGGIQDEKPIAVPAGLRVDLALPPGLTLKSVRFLTPERPGEEKLEAGGADRARFVLPEFLVYGLARIELTPRP